MPTIGLPGPSVDTTRAVHYEVDSYVDYLKILDQLKELLNVDFDERMTVEVDWKETVMLHQGTIQAPSYEPEKNHGTSRSSR
jgi:hypothetical protein